MESKHSFKVKHGMFYGWHVLPPNRKLLHGDGRVVEPGKSLSINPAYLKAQRFGLHMAATPADAIDWGHPQSVLLCRTIGQGAYNLDYSGKMGAFETRTVLWIFDLRLIKTAYRKLIGEALIEHCEEPIPEGWIPDIHNGLYRYRYTGMKRMKYSGKQAGALERIMRRSATMLDIYQAGTWIDIDAVLSEEAAKQSAADLLNTLLAKHIDNYEAILAGTADEYNRSTL